MKKYLFFAMAGALLASCASDEFDGSNALNSGNGEISFSMSTPNVTRGGTAEDAAKLGNNFIVYGYKNAKDVTEATDATNDQLVMDRYNVSYTANSANTTKSNTNNWEYVGNTSVAGKEQTIKYWDFSAEQYVFSAVSGTGFTATKTTTADEIAKKGWTISVPQGGSISDLYASDRRVMTKHEESGVNKYDVVEFTFYSLVSKVRFGFYETIPGYKVKINKFYYGESSSSDTHMAVNGTFYGLKEDGETKFTVTYADAYDKAKPIASTDGSATTSKLFGTNLQAQANIGTASNAATYDQEDCSYTCILPYQSRSLETPAENVLTLKLDYTLISTDDSGEEIKVYGATASVPTEYTQWKNNYAYTYLFKISDNTSGKTGEDDKDPKGLYPVTFDACVAGETGGIQETISSVTEPSITTYQEGAVVTGNDEYKAGTIYYTSTTGTTLNDVDGSKVYEVYYTGTAPLTEELVKNYANNDVTLINVSHDEAENVAGSKFAEKKCRKFTAVAGKTYAINCGDGWKLVKVAGTYSAPTFTWTVNTAEISVIDGKAKVTLTSDDAAVIGAKNMLTILINGTDVTDNFIITENPSGVFELQLTDKALQDNAYGTYKVKYRDVTSGNITVNLAYTLNYTEVTVTAGNKTGASTELKIGGAAHDGTIVNTNTGIKVENTGTGAYKVTATSDCAYNTTGYTLTIGGVTLTVKVDKYAFSPSSLEINKKAGETTTGSVTLQLNNGTTANTIKYSNLTGQDVNVATGTGDAGVYTLTAVKGGQFTLQYDNSSVQCNVIVNEYSLNPASAEITKETGSTTLTLKKDNGSVSQVELTGTAGFEVYKGDTKKTSGYSLTTTTDGNLKFANVSEAGTYKIKYKVDSNVVAIATVTVN